MLVENLVPKTRAFEKQIYSAIVCHYVLVLSCSLRHHPSSLCSVEVVAESWVTRRSLQVIIDSIVARIK
jgi:hypothetical protein